MPRYIEAEKLKLRFENALTDFINKFEIPMIIDDTPAADVKEVKNGEWSVICGLYTCSNCGVEVSGIVFDEWKFCPYCGCAMDGKERRREGSET